MNLLRCHSVSVLFPSQQRGISESNGNSSAHQNGGFVFSNSSPIPTAANSRSVGSSPSRGGLDRWRANERGASRRNSDGYILNEQQRVRNRISQRRYRESRKSALEENTDLRVKVAYLEKVNQELKANLELLKAKIGELELERRTTLQQILHSIPNWPRASDFHSNSSFPSNVVQNDPQNGIQFNHFGMQHPPANWQQMMPNFNGSDEQNGQQSIWIEQNENGGNNPIINGVHHSAPSLASINLSSLRISDNSSAENEERNWPNYSHLMSTLEEPLPSEIARALLLLSNISEEEMPT